MLPQPRQTTSFLLLVALLATPRRSAAAAFEGPPKLIATTASSMENSNNGRKSRRGGVSSHRSSPQTSALAPASTEADGSSGSSSSGSISGDVDVAADARSNSTHVVWMETTPPSPGHGAGAGTGTGTSSPSSGVRGAIRMRVQDRGEAERECLSYLRRNLMEYDVPNLGSLGFPPDEGEGATKHEEHSSRGDEASDDDEETDAVPPDGLSNGLVGPTVSLSLDAKSTYPWTDRLPRDVFMEYVLSFSHLNEGRSNWRPLLRDAIRPAIDRLLDRDEDRGIDHANSTVTVEEVVMAVNDFLWTKAFDKPITFKAGHTPLIYDPMSVLAFGYASCTGLSVFLACALRAAGVAARVAGTAAWHGEEEDGNHSWVEVFDPDGGGGWRITEALTDGQLADPCKYWFCNKEHFDGRTMVHAARLVRGGVGGEGGGEGQCFPMAWDPNNLGVPAEDRSEAMTQLCAECSTSAEARGL